MKKFNQQNPPHPGAILLDLYFGPLKLSVEKAASKLFVTKRNLDEVINGKSGITASLALRLAKAFNTTPQYWLTLQTNYDLHRVARKSKGLDSVRVLV